jgi:hypothetical protein
MVVANGGSTNVVGGVLLTSLLTTVCVFPGMPSVWYDCNIVDARAFATTVCEYHAAMSGNDAGLVNGFVEGGTADVGCSMVSTILNSPRDMLSCVVVFIW